MKDTFNKVLEDSRAERAVVIESFMKAYEQVLTPAQSVCQADIRSICLSNIHVLLLPAGCQVCHVQLPRLLARARTAIC